LITGVHKVCTLFGSFNRESLSLAALMSQFNKFHHFVSVFVEIEQSADALQTTK